jgi:hypothetical protein
MGICTAAQRSGSFLGPTLGGLLSELIGVRSTYTYSGPLELWGALDDSYPGLGLMIFHCILDAPEIGWFSIERMQSFGRRSLILAHKIKCVDFLLINLHKSWCTWWEFTKPTSGSRRRRRCLKGEESRTNGSEWYFLVKQPSATLRVDSTIAHNCHVSCNTDLSLDLRMKTTEQLYFLCTPSQRLWVFVSFHFNQPGNSGMMQLVLFVFLAIAAFIPGLRLGARDQPLLREPDAEPVAWVARVESETFQNWLRNNQNQLETMTVLIIPSS